MCLEHGRMELQIISTHSQPPASWLLDGISRWRMQVTSFGFEVLVSIENM